MIAVLKSINIKHISSSLPTRLQQIADALGVPVEDFSDPIKPYVIYTSDDGSYWTLGFSLEANPVIIHVCVNRSGSQIIEESILEFISNNIGSPQLKSFIDLINKILTPQILSIGR